MAAVASNAVASKAVAPKASPWGAPIGATLSTTTTLSLSEIMAQENNQQKIQHTKCIELQSILPHLSQDSCLKLLQLSDNNIETAITKAFDLGATALELLLNPPKTQEELDHDLAIALSLAENVEQELTSSTNVDIEEREEELPIKPSGIMRHDKALSEKYNAARLSGRKGVGDLSHTNIQLSNKVYNSLKHMNHRKTAKGMLTHGGGRVSQETRGTSEGVLDQRTRKIVMNLINKEVLESLGGVIATGKEASAFSAYGVGVPIKMENYVVQKQETETEIETETKTKQEKNADNISTSSNLNFLNPKLTSSSSSSSEPTTTPTLPVQSLSSKPEPRPKPQHLVVKFFRTTLSKFKNRADYVEGDSRYAKSKFKSINTTKVLKMWAAKEFRNLIRMERFNIPCPKPLHVHDHTLVMSMISRGGNNSGLPAPQLREVKLSPQKLRHCFTKIAVGMRALYQRAKLVHSDLSEFNLLYVGGKELPIIFIDVGQAVDLSHPKHIEYLGRDCNTIIDFFTRRCTKLNCSFGLPSTEELLMYIVQDEKEEKDEDGNMLSNERIDVLALKRIKRKMKV